MVVPKKYTIGSREIRHSRNNHPPIPKVPQNLPNHEPAKHSTRANGLVRAYAACTNQGPVRQYNEDRVSIILNFNKPEHCTDWKKAAYFGVFDGHGGVDCADYLRDSLHTFVVKEKRYVICLSQLSEQYPRRPFPSVLPLLDSFLIKMQIAAATGQIRELRDCGVHLRRHVLHR